MLRKQKNSSHNLKVVGSNPTPATILICRAFSFEEVFVLPAWETANIPARSPRSSISCLPSAGVLDLMPVNRGQRRMEQWLRSRCKLELVLKNSLLLLKHLQLCVQRERVGTLHDAMSPAA